MQRYIPKYVPPKQAAENRARLRTRLFWIAVGLPVVFAFLAFGYSDQAPAGLRSVIISVDRLLGYPLAALLSTISPR